MTGMLQIRRPLSRTTQILCALCFGILFGLFVRQFFGSQDYFYQIVFDVIDVGGVVLVRLMKMIVIPVVSVSIVCGIANLTDVGALGKIGLKTMLLYLLTTALAISLAMFFAELFHIGTHMSLGDINALELQNAPSLKHTLIHIVPDNPIAAMVNSQMLQVIVFSCLVGCSVLRLDQGGQPFKDFFVSMNKVLMSLVTLVMKFVPLGVFCLMAKLVLKTGFFAILTLGHYFFTVLLVLLCQFYLVYGGFLWSVGLSPWVFFQKMLSAVMFAFSISSSNASIPVVLETVRKKLGVSHQIGSFVIPLGATLNMDGTAIMQGVATVFIANAFNVPMGMSDFLVVILMATIASVGTAGVPGVGLITLAMVLQQVGIPVEGIALIVGVDRLLDMARTAVNITGDSMVACVVARSTKQLDLNVYHSVNTQVVQK